MHNSVNCSHTTWELEFYGPSTATVMSQVSSVWYSLAVHHPATNCTPRSFHFCGR